MSASEQREVAEVESLRQLGVELSGLLGVKVWEAETNLKLERMRWLVEAAGFPYIAYRSVHIGGTSGKGSVASATSSILSAHGARVGLHLSPFVQTLNETWQIDGRNVLPSVALQSARALITSITSVPQPYGLPSYFEFKVALAFQLFKELSVDRAVVEVGLGGMLDATNVLGPGVKLLTNVGLDHVDILGDTVEKIAMDKVGIFKPNSTVIAGVEQESVRKIVRDECNQTGSHLWLINENFRIDRVAPEGLLVELNGKSKIVVKVPPHWQRYQDVNAGLALAAAIESADADLDPERCSAALSRVSLPGRVEVFEDSHGTVILDGAHNEDKLAASFGSVKARFPGRRCVGVVALKSGKETQKIVEILARNLSGVVFTTFDAPPWLCVPTRELEVLAREIGMNDIEVQENPKLALERARDLASDSGIVLVTGSLYLAGNVRSCWIGEAAAALRGGSYASV